MKLKRKQLQAIYEALKGISASKLSEGAWNVIRNQKTVFKILEDQDDAINAFQKDCFDKDEEGNPKKYTEKVDIGGGQSVDHEVFKITDPEKQTAFDKFVRDMVEQEYDIELIRVSKNAFNKMIDKGQLDLNCLVPLLDVMIPDPDKKVDEADG